MNTVKKNFVIVLTAFLFIMMGLTFTSCLDEEIAPVAEETIEDPDEYYVRYEFSYSSRYLGKRFDMTINTEKGLQSFIVGSREIIIGPVKKGFESSMDVKDQRNGGFTDSTLKMYATIYVSKNNGPFALKANNGSEIVREFVELSYLIDN